MRTSVLARSALVTSALLFIACSGSGNGSGFTNGPTNNGSNGGGASGDDGSGSGSGNSPGSLGNSGDAGPNAGSGGCSADPGFYDIPGDHCDNDGDGKVDNVLACDQGLPATGDAAAFAKALGLCQTAGANDSKWGVISATYTNGHVSTKGPNDKQHGILPKFGDVVKPREGAMLGVLSSGSASEQDSDNGPWFKGQKDGMQGPPSVPIPGFPGGGQGGDAPQGYPKSSPACGGVTLASGVNDVINVKLQIRVPKNAKGLSFDFDFYSGEWPEYVCSQFNDSFIAFLSSKGFNGGKPDNISFDAKGNPVSVNNGFFDRCTPKTTTGCVGGHTAQATCPGGVSELTGTGFGVDASQTDGYCKGTPVSSSGGATGWLTTQAPVQPGEVITLEFMIWDTGDASWDSSVLLDNFQWQPNPVDTGTTRPPPR